jgi:hypothetical protein
MGKKRARRREEGQLFPEVRQIIALLSEEPSQDLVILIVPSHDKRNAELGEARQAEWASATLHLFADLYRGATAFKTFKGIYKTEEGQYLLDEPILIESFASHADIADEAKLNELVRFAKRMGHELEQAAIMLVIGKVMIYIEEYGAT